MNTSYINEWQYCTFDHTKSMLGLEARVSPLAACLHNTTVRNIATQGFSLSTICDAVC